MGGKLDQSRGYVECEYMEDSIQADTALSWRSFQGDTSLVQRRNVFKFT